MAKLRQSAQNALADAAPYRLRAAWLYYTHGLTQQAVAEQLGIGRSTVIRLLDEALKRGEVKFWIEEGEPGTMGLATQLEQALGLDEAIVVPECPNPEVAAKSVGLALGKFLSEAIVDHMTIGVGWGRTLTASLASFHPNHRTGIKVMSLLGGMIKNELINPVDVSWRMASQLHADCYLFPVPLIVDSVETKRRLIENCGMGTLFKMAKGLDVAVLSVGDIGPKATSLGRQSISKQEFSELIALGCACDLLCNFLDDQGRPVAHPLNERVMSIDLDTLRSAKHIVLACGGSYRARAILAVIRRVGCNTLVTDEGAARAILATVGAHKAPGARSSAG